MKFLLEAQITPAEPKGYDAYLPALDMTTQGNDINDAVDMAVDLALTAVPLFLQEGKPIPKADFRRKKGEPADLLKVGVVVDCSANDPEIPTMSVSEAASMIGVSESRVYAMVRDGILEAEKLGGEWFISAQSVRARVNSPRPSGRPRKQAAKE